MDRLLITLLLMPLFANAEVSDIVNHSKIDLYVDNGFTLKKIESEYEKTKDERMAMEQINYYFNQYPYLEDKISRSENDYWKTPEEFLTDNGGDCEDYAIIKYFQLVSMGVPKEKFKFYYAYLKDKKIYHVMLGYKENKESEVVFLDNEYSRIVKESNRKNVFILSTFDEENIKIKVTNEKLKPIIKKMTTNYAKNISKIALNIK